MNAENYQNRPTYTATASPGDARLPLHLIRAFDTAWSERVQRGATAFDPILVRHIRGLYQWWVWTYSDVLDAGDADLLFVEAIVRTPVEDLIAAMREARGPCEMAAAASAECAEIPGADRAPVEMEISEPKPLPDQSERDAIEARERARQPLAGFGPHILGLSDNGVCIFCGEHAERIRSHPDMKCVVRSGR